MLPALLTTILFSISAVSASRSTRVLGGMTANFWRILVATVLLGVWAHLFGGGLQSVALPLFLISGCVGFGVGDLALYQALPRVGSRLSIMLVHCLAAPFAALVEWVWMGSTLTLFQIVCGLTILAGVALALAPQEHMHIPKRTLVAGVVLGVLASLGQGLGAVISRKAYDIAAAAGEPIAGLNAGVTAAYQRIWGGVAIASIGFIATRLRSLATRVPPEPQPSIGQRGSIWPWVLANGVAGPGLGVACYQWALATTKSGLVLPIIALTPLVIMPFAHFIEGERPTSRSVAGGLIAVLGVIGLRLAT